MKGSLGRSGRRETGFGSDPIWWGMDYDLIGPRVDIDWREYPEVMRGGVLLVNRGTHEPESGYTVGVVDAEWIGTGVRSRPPVGPSAQGHTFGQDLTCSRCGWPWIMQQGFDTRCQY